MIAMDKIIIAYLTLLATVYGAVNFLPYVEKPAEFAAQEGCYVPELKRVLPYDKPFRPADGKPCAIYVCYSNNETQIDTCGNAVVPEGCRRVFPADENISAVNCCGVIKCD